MIGQTISHYRITAQLGEGGMGIVYRADDLKLDRQVAIKVLPPRLSQHPEARVRLLREAKAASALQHPNICTIHEIDDTKDGQLFMVMPCYEGESLRQRLDREPMSVEESLEIGRQIASALAATHEKGIVHRDLKPGNIMLTNGGTQAVLMDFGLARPDEATQLTRTGATVGTIAYMSPEQVRGERADHRSDLWSLGVLLYEMTTGRRPFDGEGEVAVLQGILNNNPVPLRSRVPSASPITEALIDRLLEKDPKHRTQSMVEAVQELTEQQRRLELGAQEHSWWGLRSRKRRRRVAATLLAAIVVLAAIGYLTLGRHSVPRYESLAVLPLANLSADPEQEYFVDGMTDQLISSLMEIRSIRVISYRSVQRYKETEKSLPEIAEELGVDALVEGTVFRDGDRSRITARLMDGKKEESLWSDSMERDLVDVLGIQRGIAKSIAGAIEITLSPEESARLERTHTVDPKAYEAYLMGRYWWNRDFSGLEKCLPYFQRAVALDPGFVLAWAGLADAYITLGCHALRPPGEIRDPATKALDRALALDPDRAEVQTTLGHYLYEIEWDWDGTRDAWRRALELNPSYSTAHHFYGIGYYLVLMGRGEEALAEMRIAQALDPLSPNINADLAMTLVALERFDEAWQILERCQREFPDWEPSHDLNNWYAAQGRLEEAVTKVPKPPMTTRLSYYLSIGETDSIEVLVERFEAKVETEYVPYISQALVAMILGDTEEALDKLELSLEEREPWLTRLPIKRTHRGRGHGLWEPVFDNPRYLSILKSVGLD